jgi:endogenous inhibitor of DNA gyrase (YacG/DUF329 family)
MTYYAYQAGDCEQCGKEIGLIETDGGRQRQYCSDRCKMIAYRTRHKQEYRNKCLLRNTELRDYWQEHHVSGQVLVMLQNILVEHGKAAAKDATDTVLLALKLAQSDQERLTRLQAFGM